MNWITVKEAANILQCSDRHVRNMAATGRLRARKKRNSWLIHISLQESEESDKEAEGVPTESISEFERITSLLDENLWLKKRIENQEKELSELRRELAESSTRHDTIVMQLSSQLKIVESKKPWYKRLFR